MPLGSLVVKADALTQINAIGEFGNLTVTIPKRLPALEADNNNKQAKGRLIWRT